jgi:hypothetical protein
MPIPALFLFFVLSLFGRAAGIVVDEAGHPVAGARITLQHVSVSIGPLGDPLDNDLYHAVSGADGRFTVAPALAAADFERVEVIVEAAGLLSLETDRALPKGAGPADLGRLVLSRGKTASGRVTDPAGRPVAGATIWKGPSKGGYPGAEAPLAVSGPDGAFTFPTLPGSTESRDLLVCHDGDLGEQVTWNARATAPLAIVLHPAGHIRGRVVAADGTPVAGAFVAYSNPQEAATDAIPPRDDCADHPDWGVETDARGRFTLTPPRTTWYDLEARADGHPWTSLGRRLHVEEGVTIYGIEIWLPAGATVSGRVLTPAGEPLAGARVFASSSHDQHRAVADGTGGYRLSGVGSGRHSLVAEIGEGEESSQAEREIDVVPGENRVDLTLVRKVTYEVRGRVVGPDGLPVPGARVSKNLEESFSVPHAIAGDDGSFVLRLAAGAHRLAAEREGFASGVATVQVAAAGVDGIEIQLSRGCAVTGRVLGLAPGVRAGVSATPPAGSGLPFLAGGTDPEGRFRIEHLAPGEWTLAAEALPREASGKVTLAPGGPCADEEVDLALPEGFEVRGRVADPAGQPLADVWVYLDSTRGYRARTGEDGAFAVSVPNGTWKVGATVAGFFLAAPLPLQVDGGPVDGVEVVLRPGATVRGRVSGVAPGDPVEVWAAGPGDLASGWTDDDGTYRLDGLAPGEWTVSAALTDEHRVRRHEVSRTVAVPAGPAEVTLDLTLPPAPEVP